MYVHVVDPQNVEYSKSKGIGLMQMVVMNVKKLHGPKMGHFNRKHSFRSPGCQLDDNNVQLNPCCN